MKIFSSLNQNASEDSTPQELFAMGFPAAFASLVKYRSLNLDRLPLKLDIFNPQVADVSFKEELSRLSLLNSFEVQRYVSKIKVDKGVSYLESIVRFHAGSRSQYIEIDVCYPITFNNDGTVYGVDTRKATVGDMDVQDDGPQHKLGGMSLKDTAKLINQEIKDMRGSV